MIKNSMWLAAAGMLFLAGCSGEQVSPALRGPGAELAANSIGAEGGANWYGVKAITATAIVTSYDDNGQAHISQQWQVIDLCKGVICATAVAPSGGWNAQVPLCGQGQIEGWGTEPTESHQRVLADLRATLVRLYGPRMFYQGAVAGPVTSRRLGGQDLLRLPVEHGSRANCPCEAGQACWAKHDPLAAMYIDPRTCLVRFITSGCDQPGHEGIITELGDYCRLPCGLTLPTRIDTYRIGDDVLLGDVPVLKVELRNVRVLK